MRSLLALLDIPTPGSKWRHIHDTTYYYVFNKFCENNSDKMLFVAYLNDDSDSVEYEARMNWFRDVFVPW